MAIVDMSDNANKMGTSMEDIQNAYQGFAKQNYTMLDNLKLGYGGTKSEMERLLSDAQKLTGQSYDISEGVFISYVEENSPASEAGLQMGDVITAIDGKSIASYEELVAAKKGYSAGDTSTLTIYRGGKTMEVQLTWGAQPEDTTASNDTNTNTDTNDNSGDQYSQDDLNDLFRYFFGNRGYGYGG